MNNIFYPGLPDYEGPIKGYFTCLHHDGKIIEWSDNVMERTEYIEKEKSNNEIQTRLQHIVYIDPKQFPYDKIDSFYIKKHIEKLTVYLYKHVPKCRWDGVGLMFPKEPIYGDGYGYGYGNGYGDGKGYGNGDGYSNGYGDGNGYGNGYGYGNGDGNGDGNGNGDGYSNGYGDGNGYGNGYGYGYSNGYGDGYGYGYGNGYGDGKGYGNGYGNGDGNGYSNGYGYG